MKTLHAWMGLTAGVLFGLLTLTGITLVFAPELERLASPDLRIDFAGPLPADAVGRVIQGITTRYADLKPHIIDLPQTDQHYVTVWLADGTLLYVHPQNLEILKHFQRGRTFLTFLRELHVNLLLRNGHNVVGVIGLGALALALSGIFLWLRHRRAFGLRHLIPRAATEPVLLRSHHTTGIVILVFVMASLSTALLLAFGGPAHKIASVLDGRPPDYSRPRPETVAGHDTLPWPVLVRAAAQALPDGRIVMVALPKPDKPVAEFHMRLPGDWNPEGMSDVFVHSQTGEVLKTVRGDRAGPATTLLSAVYAFHSGRGMPLAYRLVVLLIGLASFWLVCLGIAAYFVRGRNTPPAQR